MSKQYWYARFYEDFPSARADFNNLTEENCKALAVNNYQEALTVIKKVKDMKVVLTYPDGTIEHHMFIPRREGVSGNWYQHYLGGIHLSGYQVINGNWSCDEINYFNSRCRIIDGVDNEA